MARELVRTIEELSLNAWPPLQTMHYDGWVLRFAAGYTRRANSANPLYHSTVDVAEKVAFCEQIYSSRGQATIFKLTPAAEPARLDAYLEQNGYARDAETSVQMLDLAQLDGITADGFTCAGTPAGAWFDAYTALNGVAARHRPTMEKMLNGLATPACFGVLQHGGSVAALGLAVQQGSYVGLYDIVTAPTLRRQGLGRTLVTHLLDWARGQGAGTAYLQVMLNNPPALSLYAGLGFSEVYRYWYRVK